MAETKVVIIGGASLTWTPNLMADLVRLRNVVPSRIVLVDVNKERLALMQKLGDRLSAVAAQAGMVREAGSGVTVESTTDRREALRDADFVLTTFDVGGNEARRRDVETLLKYGIYNEGNTVGSASIFHAFRQISLVAHLTRCSGQMPTICHPWSEGEARMRTFTPETTNTTSSG